MEPLDQSISFAICENCQTQNPPDKKFCSQCSYPIAGTHDEQQNFRFTVSSHKRLLKDAEDKIKTAKTIIYVLAGLFFVFGIISWFSHDDFATLIVNLFMSLLYLIFAAWCSKNPFGAILTAFIVYITLQVINAFVDPITIFSGLILKIFFIGAFIKGIRSASEAQQSMKELEKFKAMPGGNN